MNPRTALITGASSGIGEALARHYASPQSVLGLIARRPLNLSLPGTTAAYAVDVTDERALAAAAQDFIGRFGPPDLVIANAGVSAGTLGEDIRDVAKLRRVLEVNVTGLAATLAAFAPAMREAGRGLSRMTDRQVRLLPHPFFHPRTRRIERDQFYSNQFSTLRPLT